MSSSSEQYPSICLKPREERRIRKGHLWVYSNEIDVQKTPIKGFEPGSLVALESAKGQCLGLMHLNPNHLICGRLLTRNPKTKINQAYFKERISRALELRELIYQAPYYRLMFGDADYLPGVVVDRFGDTLVVQVSTAGMERALDDFLVALDELLQPEKILLKNDGKMRESEGLPEYVKAYKGEMPEQLELIENGVRFIAPFETGQKTGWFYDHAPNRQRLQALVQGKRVLDLCSYVGGWGVQAAVAGASEVLCVDSSQQAMDYVQKNAQLNGVEDKVKLMKGDAFKCMQQLLEEGQSFDIVVIDPPALISRRKDIRSGENAYYAWNQAALRLIPHSGWLVSASCSMHLSYDRLRDLVRGAGREIDRQLQFVEIGHQGMDHPVHPAIPETEYLKSLLVRVNFVRSGKGNRCTKTIKRDS
jgi:23S rRNA (cytosine1962-C5)-methyltransferase